MRAILSEQSKFETWLEVEAAVCEGQEHFGKIPEGTTAVFRKRAAEGPMFTIERIEEIEAVRHHDLISFVSAVTENLGDEGRYVHYGVTSYDIEDTAMALMMVRAADLLIRDLEALGRVLAKLAKEYKSTVMIARTHGVHAEPITFGYKMAVYFSQIQRDIERMQAAREAIRYGKISGAVGVYGNVDPEVEEYVCTKLNLKVSPVSTQIIQRDRHASYISAIAIAAGTLESLATEMRNLQRTEIREVQEMFLPGQRGSSAMPHKRNPWRFETICGLAKVIRGYMIPALEDISTWHERDLTNSSVERVIVADSCQALDFMLQSMVKLMSKLEVLPENMKRNLEMMGQFVFSEHVLLVLIQKGLTRDEAYEICQRNSARVWDESISYREALEQDEDATSRLSGKDLFYCFNLEHHLRNVDKIFKRLGLDD